MLIVWQRIFFHKAHPNEGAREELRIFLQFLQQSIYKNPHRLAHPEGPFVFSCFHDYEEDYGTTQFLMNEMKSACPTLDVRFLSFYDMIIDDEGILLPDGSHAGALYRLHPLEILIDETTNDGEPLGEMFLDLYMERKFALFNPPEAIVLQNKSFMSLVSALYLTEQFFTGSERDIIAQYLTPSYFESDFDALPNGQYIQKEIWGREGRNVQVVEKNCTGTHVSIKKLVHNYDDIIARESHKVMYQDFIEQKKFIHTVDSGTKEGYLTMSCFMLGDKTSAVGCRFSPEKIAGTEAYFVPLVID
nr:glutathionylspermidine synthase family protein [Veillonella agrestimuris]